MIDMDIKKVRVIAFYLPQFHPIPENDAWWGKGFTEWTNVGKAKPLFRGHYQPRVPADLGYYDLRMPEVREAQAEMASEAGIEGFCYWHYWFGNGRQLLERPFNEVLESGKPDFPFCLGWANHSWSNKSWHAGLRFSKESVLMDQIYPGKEDHTEHFFTLIKAFKDKRYLYVDGKPLFVIYDPFDIPDVKSYISLWKELAIKNGLNGLYFVAVAHNLIGFHLDKDKMKRYYVPNSKESSDIYYNNVLDMGFDAVNSRGSFRAELIVKGRYLKVFQYAINKLLGNVIISKYKYSQIIDYLYVKEDSWENVYPTIIPNWDRSPRSGKQAIIWHGSTPELFGKSVKKALETIKNKTDEHQIMFLMSWNEWAEGNYIEPDIIFGRRYLEVLKDALKR
jgi:hypothetical protein